MKLHSLHRSPIVLALGTLLTAPSASLGDEQERVPVATTPHFAFYSDFSTNLNDALIAAGEARNDGEPELFHSGAEKSCFDELRSSRRAGWNRAVDYYAEIISPSNSFGLARRLVGDELAGVRVISEDAWDRGFIQIAKGFQAAASPAYEACRWTAQDAENRQWIDELIQLLKIYEAPVAQKLANLYAKSWHGLPIPVDVVSTADSTGARTLNLEPDGGHTLISSSNPGYKGHAALEMVFHEASHTLTGRGAPMPLALYTTADDLGREIPRDFGHLMLFYTTGETVRRVLAEADEPDYTMALDAFDLWNGPWGRYRDAVVSIWPAYLDGEHTLSEAASDLIQALREPEGDGP